MSLQAEPTPEGATEVSVTKDPSVKLGLDCSHSADKKCLKVKGVKAGPFETWNRANPDNTVEAGDLVIEINGVKRNSEKMLKQIRGASCIVLKVQKVFAEL